MARLLEGPGARRGRPWSLRPGPGTRTSRAGRRGSTSRSPTAARPISIGSMSPTDAPAMSASAARARSGVAPRPIRPMPQRSTRSSPSSSTATAAPAMAKSPCRRASSSTATPQRPLHTGNVTAVSSSSGASAVDHSPVNSSAAGMVRVPRGEVASISASSASATAGYSPAGSAWAMQPPTVPRLRICACPTNGVARASRGTASATSALCSTAASVVPAPMRRCPSRALDAGESRRCGRCRPGARSWPGAGRASGTRLWPPASTLASSPRSASRPTASSTVPGRWYSKGAGFTTHLPVRPWSASAPGRPGRAPARG